MYILSSIQTYSLSQDLEIKTRTQEMMIIKFNLIFSAAFIASFLALSSAAGGNPFMTSDFDQVAGKSFDYIVIGGGTAGCPLAATLSQEYSVLLVERGGSPYGKPEIDLSSYYGFPMTETDEFTSVAQKFISEEGLPAFRGRVLGGTSCINGGFYSRAPKDYIRNVGWDEELVKDSYEWVESKVATKALPLRPLHVVMMDAFLEAGVLPFNGFSWEHLEGTKIGASIFDGIGRRHTSADLLRAGNSERITVLLNATVHSILFQAQGEFEGDEKKMPIRARGIRFIDSNGSTNDTYEAYLAVRGPKSSESEGDVILSAGTLGSPQILMLSGIGPKEHLRDFNISTLVDARGVGRDLQDNPSMVYRVNLPDQSPPDPPQIAGIAFNFQTMIQPMRQYRFNGNVTTIIVSKLIKPESRGHLRLNSTDPRQNPSVRYNLLSTESDLEGCVRNAQLLERVVFSEALLKFYGTQLPGFMRNGTSTVEELRDHCKKNVSAFYHNHGGCEVGEVIDKDHKVYGVEGVRVVDASTLRDTPGTNPMATLMMLGRYQGIQILREREREKEKEMPYDIFYLKFSSNVFN